MVSEPIAVIQEVARAAGGRVRATSLFDANVSRRSPVPQQSWELSAAPGEFFRHEVSVTVSGHKVTFRANGAFVVAHVLHNLDVAVVSINRRDRIMCLKDRLSGFPPFRFYRCSLQRQLAILRISFPPFR